MKALDCVHADTCLPDYWSGHHLAHVQIPVYKGIHLSEVKRLIRRELWDGAVMGNNPLTRDDSGEAGDKWYSKANAAVNRIQHAQKGKRRMFESLEPAHDNDGEATVYAYFVFVEKE